MTKIAKHDQASLVADEVVEGVMIIVYAATHNEDTTEGRGRMVDKSYHTKCSLALIACKGIDVMGTDGKVVKRLALGLSDGRVFLLKNNATPIVVVDDETEVANMATARESALKKLSPSERAALGL